MNPSETETVKPDMPNWSSPVPPEEVERRIAEFRQKAFENQFPPQVVYHPPHQACPWPGCGYRIAGIIFHLDKMGTPEQQQVWVQPWWLGPGLIARCPGCRRLVLFDVQEKQFVGHVGAVHVPLLPDNWHETAYVLPKPGE
jgi:hypothetical protein